MRHKLSLDVNYVHDWTVQDAIRELFQNAVDWGNWSWSMEDHTLRLTSHNTQLAPATLLLGHSRKAEGSIGQFGEGYKLAALVLTRRGYKLTIRTGKEVWIPKLINSRTYKTQQLVFDTEPEAEEVDSISFEVSGLTEGDKLGLRNYNCWVDPRLTLADTEYGRILHKNEAGKVYVGGLFVCVIEGMKYGYDLKPTAVSLDRDRRMVREFDLQWLTSQMWLQVEDKGLTAELVKEGAKDVQYLDSFWRADTSLADEVAEQFVSEHGRDAVPVVDQQDVELAKHQGHTNIVVVPRSMAGLIRNSTYYTPPPAKLAETPEEQLKLFFVQYRPCMSHEMETAFKRLIERSTSWRDGSTV